MVFVAFCSFGSLWSLMLKLLSEEVERLRLSFIWALRMLIAWVASVAEKVRFLRKSPVQLGQYKCT